MQLYQLIFLLFLSWLWFASSHQGEEDANGSKQLASDETEYDKSTEKSGEKDISENVQEPTKILQNQKESRLKKNKVKVGNDLAGEHWWLTEVFGLLA